MLLRDIAAIKEKVGAIEGQLNSVERRLDSLEAGQREIKGKVGVIKNG